MAGRLSAARVKLERSTAAHVGLRLVVGFAVYFALNALWLLVGFDRLYSQTVERLSVAIVPALTHFPLSSATIEPLTVHNPGHAQMLALALALAVGRLSWGDRVVRYGALSLLLAAIHVASMAIQLHLALALRLEQNSGIAVLVPWEQEILRRLFQLMFAAGLQIVPFVMIALTAYWTDGRSPSEWLGDVARPRTASRSGQPRWQRPALVAAAVAVGLTWFGAYRVRETDPRHVRAHVRVGTAFLAQQRLDDAELQFRAAIRAGTSDVTAWLGLAAIAWEHGRRDEARDLLRRALETVETPTGRDRLRQRLEIYRR